LGFINIDVFFLDKQHKKSPIFFFRKKEAKKGGGSQNKDTTTISIINKGQRPAVLKCPLNYMNENLQL